MTDLGRDDHDLLPPLDAVEQLVPPDLTPVSDEALAGVGADQQRRHALRAFGTQVRAARRAAGFRTAADLAAAVRHAGVDGAVVATWERGHAVPGGDEMAAVEAVLGTVPGLRLAWLALDPDAAPDPDDEAAAPAPVDARRVEELEARVAELEQRLAALTAPDHRGHTAASRGWAARARNLAITGR